MVYPLMGYYLAVRNEVLIDAIIWMNLENILFSETSQSQRITYCLCLYELDRTSKSITAAESRLGVAWGCRGGMRGIGNNCK